MYKRVIVFLGLLGAALAALGGDHDPTLWTDPSRTQAKFVSGEALAQLDISRSEFGSKQAKLLTGADIEQLRALVERAKARGSDCFALPRFESFAEPGPARQLTLAQVAKSGDFAVLGTVDNIVQGWSTQLIRPAALVQLRITAVLFDRQHQIRTGTKLSYLQRAGSLLIEKRPVCSVDPENQAAEGGRDLLLIGTWDRDNPGTAELLHAFSVTGDRIELPKDPKLKPYLIRDSRAGVTELRAALAEVR